VPDAVGAGTEVPRRLSRRSLDFTETQAVRVQWAHSLSQESIQLRLEYWNPTSLSWKHLTPLFGNPVPAFENQVGVWVSAPVFVIAKYDLRVRAVVVGDGELDPKLTYITLDTR